MYISDQEPTKILTKCSKMTDEDSTKGHGMNGTSETAIKEEFPKSNYVPGGRLKFFKDGKFILELERAREGERVSWVSVPRKTFWPPKGPAPSASCKQESSASLSVSDDNSSIQSSPWQRDHSWKQTSPRKNISKQMTFFYCRSKKSTFRLKCSKKTRRPYSKEPEDLSSVLVCSNNSDKKLNYVIKKEKKLKISLLVIIQSLIDKKSSGTGSSIAQDAMVSPRKRFLRDMEKDKVQVEDNVQKRSRNKTPASQPSTSSNSTWAPSLPKINGTSEEKTIRNSSYSITSLLADDRTIKRSPSNSPSQFGPPLVAHPPKSEEPWYSESVEKFRSIELTHAEKNMQSYPHHHHSYMPTFIYPYSLPNTCYTSGVYSRGYPMPPNMYHHPSPSLPVSVVQRQHSTSQDNCHWGRETTSSDCREEGNHNDMPLNLSKNAG